MAIVEPIYLSFHDQAVPEALRGYGVAICRAVGAPQGRQVVVLQGDRRLGVVDLKRRDLIGEPVAALGRRVLGPAAVGELAGHAVVAYSGSGMPLWIWRLADGRERAVEVGRPIYSLTITADSTIVVGSRADALVIHVDEGFFEEPSSA